MSQVLKDLLTLLSLEKIEQGLYRGQSQDLGFKALFGGQVMGQALSAAQESVEVDRHVHSLHSYFLRPGDAAKPVIYEVENIRDGRSFNTRRVKAIQNGQAIFYMTASFQLEEKGFDHQNEMPDVVGPDELPSFTDFIFDNQQYIPENVRGKFLSEKPIELKPVEQYNWIKPEKSEPICHMWIKANGQLPDDPRIHKYMLAYTSDFHFLPTALFSHGVSHWQPNFQIATIDHAMWFHRPFRFDDWLLYVMESPTSVGGRGLVRGQIYNQAGDLVATTMQEGVIRQR
ncbi:MULTISPECIES: acyl-CoA thioesterase II [Thalassotalea]|uniref:Acyl-CoA thioesterase II n=1 Tax=Thalassotalea castellviae TaxID=3075612 RepID=A0ABU3A201_9GAMM|nr:acyl-CoA thioesterase II [Thalassotalea sp. W431]MDT0604211.1 acyl-CoA thioesterase II [Thalassotalea sp. W431]